MLLLATNITSGVDSGEGFIIPQKIQFKTDTLNIQGGIAFATSNSKSHFLQQKYVPNALVAKWVCCQE